MREIYKNIYMGDIILPKTPLKSLNSYIIKSNGKALIIDTGFDHIESEECFFAELEELELKKGSVDLYLTHLHADHTGLSYKFQKRYGGNVYSGEIEADYINSMTNKDYFETHQFQVEYLGLDNDGHFFDSHPAVIYGPKKPVNFKFVKEGDIIEVGEYRFEVIFLPGHTLGHTALYEKKHRLLFCGDHILDKITPNISFWGFEYKDILGTYLKSLDKVYNMDIDIIFPAHRTIIKSHKIRIEELKKHHQDRLADIMNILSDREKRTVKYIASKMHWDFRAKDFESFPNNQKWFACGEAMAHLEHLVLKGMIDMIDNNELRPLLFYKK